jgi:hypothetical protein
MAASKLNQIDQKKQAAYQALFYSGSELTESARIVLDDLTAFCRLNSMSAVILPTGVDTHATMLAEGRREVALRVLAMLNITIGTKL